MNNEEFFAAFCPPKNHHCVCGSGRKYKHCCRPKGVENLTVPPFGQVTRVRDVYLNGEVYPVFIFDTDSEPDDDYHMILDKRLQDEGYARWLRPPSVSDGPNYNQIVKKYDEHGKPNVTPGQIFEMNLLWADASLVQVDVIAKGFRTRVPLMAVRRMIITDTDK